MRYVRPLLRLPSVVFPKQTVSLRRVADSCAANDTPFGVAESLLEHAAVSHKGCVASFGPGSRVGVQLHVMEPHATDDACPTPEGIAHAVGGERVRLLRSFRDVDELSGAERQVCEVELIADETLSPSRRGRLEDEAETARSLLERVEADPSVLLESSVLDEELGGPICDPSCHPMHATGELPPDDAAQLSHWLGSRLPLTTGLRTQLLGCACPLQRMKDAVDILRLLCDPHRARGDGYRFKLLVSHAASNTYCGTGLSASAHPRVVVSQAPPPFAGWSSENSFPHG